MPLSRYEAAYPALRKGCGVFGSTSNVSSTVRESRSTNAGEEHTLDSWAVAPAANRLHVFQVTGAGKLRTATWNPETQSVGKAWAQLSDKSSAPHQDVLALASGEQQVDVFAVTPGGTIMCFKKGAKSGGGSWQDPFSLAGVLTSSTIVGAASPGRLDVFIVDLMGNVHTSSCDSTGANGEWQPWSPVAAPAPWAPIEQLPKPPLQALERRLACVGRPGGRMDVFFFDTAIFHSFRETVSGPWTDWIPVIDEADSGTSFVGLPPFPVPRQASICSE